MFATRNIIWCQDYFAAANGIKISEQFKRLYEENILG